ncbi:LysR family transcriptional regulator [Streptomyces piniterrae]|uniref:LysR family transcriptional regulator n=1 Tax=Streptomyces piniterrae TaxID=2571125 RepID=A0A4U0NJD2_9ACTN|nr:LysR family transcriptional regulator [Streptomyces piniterrae]TJZ54300.1 LysR family transcriptional regulator [Streptomyces piniterrae]
MELELRHARIVWTIAEVGSISKAAGWLNVPQPSLTTQLRRIEKMLGGDLFVRSRSGIVPTSLGKRLIPMLARLVQQADEVTSEAAASIASTFRFGNTEWTPPTLLAAIQASMPTVDVETETLAPAAAVEAVHGGALTVAMIPCSTKATPDYVRHPDLDTTVIFREPIWLAVSRGHPLADLDSVDGTCLTGLNWVHYSRDHWFHEVEKDLLAQLDQTDLGGSHHVDGHHEAMNWVRDTDAAALTPPTGVTGDVRLVPIRETQTIELMLVWRRGAVGRETSRRLVETVRRYYCGYASTIPGYWPWIVEHAAEFPELSHFLPLPTPSG